MDGWIFLEYVWDFIPVKSIMSVIFYGLYIYASGKIMPYFAFYKMSSKRKNPANIYIYIIDMFCHILWFCALSSV